MTEPMQPADPPAEGASPAHNPTGATPHGIPEAMTDGAPAASPTSDRHETEIAPLRGKTD
ncbi:MAG: hypothetical protein NVSMB18_31690 [Acetobacteraceae bacterium]